jgi:hypothetical protein
MKELQVRIEESRITEYQVNMMVTYVLDDKSLNWRAPSIDLAKRVQSNEAASWSH